MDDQEDWLATGPLIEARLRAEVSALRKVAGIDELAELRDLDARTGHQAPAAFVVYDGPRMDPAKGEGGGESGAHRWLVVLAVRSARDGGDGAARKREAGLLLPQISNALRGWAPEEYGRTLRSVTPPRPGYGASLAYFPLAFELPFAR